MCLGRRGTACATPARGYCNSRGRARHRGLKSFFVSCLGWVPRPMRQRFSPWPSATALSFIQRARLRRQPQRRQGIGAAGIIEDAGAAAADKCSPRQVQPRSPPFHRLPHQRKQALFPLHINRRGGLGTVALGGTAGLHPHQAREQARPRYRHRRPQKRLHAASGKDQDIAEAASRKSIWKGGGFRSQARGRSSPRAANGRPQAVHGREKTMTRPAGP